MNILAVDDEEGALDSLTSAIRTAKPEASRGTEYSGHPSEDLRQI